MSPHVKISIGSQKLVFFTNGGDIRKYIISTASNGAGELMDSECTPTGKHIIGEKIGDKAEINSVFVGRIATGELYCPQLRRQSPGRDWILTRILWLSGCEPGRNKGGKVDSRARYIYIHGSPDDVAMGVPGSKGCIRMRNQDIIELFDLVDIGTEVYID